MVESRRSLSVRIIAFAAFSFCCYFGAPVIITIFLAILLAYLLSPFVGLLEKAYLPRSISILFVMAITAVLLGGLIFLFVDRMREFSDNLPKYRTRIEKVQRDIQNRIRVLQKRSEDLGSTILPQSKKDPEVVRIQQYSTWGEFLFRELDPVYDSLLLVSFFPFLVYFLLQEKDQIRLFVSSFIRSRTSLSSTFVSDTSEKIVNAVNDKIRGFIFGYLLSTLILFLVSWLIFFAFGVEQSVIWSFLFTCLNILPFVGAFLGVIPPLLVAILQFASIQKAIIFIAVCITVHLIYANWLIPRTTGPRTELTPLISLIAMMYWGFLWGGIGIFLAVPITASLKTIWIEYRLLQNTGRIESFG